MKKCILIVVLMFSLLFEIIAEEKKTMNSTIIQNGLTFTAGGLIAVESTLLLIGMNIPEISPWTNIKNTPLALSDILLGGLLIYFSLSGNEYHSNPWYYFSIGLLMATHLYRDAEFFSSINEPFIHNKPLFILNNVRLGLLGGSLGLSIHFRL